MTITKDKFAAINYILKDTEGVELDSSVGTEPLGYIHGRGYLIPGLEAQLEGKAAGDKFTCTIEPKDAYGERDDRLVAQVTRDKFEEGSPIELGMHFQVMTPAGPSIVRITEINDDTITIDGDAAVLYGFCRAKNESGQEIAVKLPLIQLNSSQYNALQTAVCH